MGKTMSDISEAPWTPEQVANLNEFQTSRYLHPFTCGGERRDAAHTAYQEEHGGDFGQLVATPDGWICPVCDYRQNWAHSFMADGSAVIHARQVREALRSVRGEDTDNANP